ncbi:Radical SAM superfamily enzyme, MoaA/NifB/PqqE/SkfB family [Lachnospiraceae bacterium XBB2008]|nr:Radical SAM superfamily enzyme, MoaA/NifB/PqqE/SkfB family [Lachnospiraceae bacterium XBB2008]
MNKDFDIQEYMTRGVESIVADALRATLKNPRESAYMVRFAAASKAASVKRAAMEKKGEHIPPFLIASITSSCNLHCAGCYSRCNQATTDEAPVEQLSDEDWSRIFDEADELGVSFILLAGGEPLLRKGVIDAAGERPNILFPVFTNGTFMGEKYFELFDRCRNIVPIMSIEGNKEITDARRGEGVYDKLVSNMDELCKRGLIFGTSVTVTSDNYADVSSEEFISLLSDKGCKAVIFVEFVPVTGESSKLAPGDEEREYLSREIERLRAEHPEMVFVSFPGDEKSSGGCIAAGRGFFHINSHGGAEPCPFSPYSDINVKDSSLREAMKSKLFRSLIDGGLLNDDHKGGCVLFEKRDQVTALQENTRAEE